MPSALPLNVLLPKNEDVRATGPSRLFQRKSTTLEVLGAQFASAFMDTDTQLIIRKAQNLFAEEKDDIVDQKELNKQFPQLDIPFNKPTSLALAEKLVKTDARRKSLQRVIQNGAPDSLMQQASGLLLGVGANLLDPIGMATGAAIGKGLMVTMGRTLMRGGKLARAARPLSKGLGGKIFEGAVGNAAQELLIGQPLLKQEKVDVDHYNNLQFAIGAGILFPVVATGSRSLWKFIRGGKNGQVKTTKAYALAESQLESGKRLNTEPYINAEMRKELPELQQELQTAKEAGDLDKIGELEDVVQRAEQAPIQDRAMESRRANSIQEDLFYEPEIERDLKAGETELFPSDRTSEFDASFKDISEQVSELEAAGDLDPNIKKSLDAARAEIDGAETFDEMARLASFCVKG